MLDTSPLPRLVIVSPTMGEMKAILGEKSHKDERRLFESNVRLSRARAELAIGEEQHSVLAELAEEARMRAIVAETPLAVQEWQSASRHADALAASLETSRHMVRDLERLQDDLIAKLVGG